MDALYIAYGAATALGGAAAWLGMDLAYAKKVRDDIYQHFHGHYKLEPSGRNYKVIPPPRHHLRWFGPFSYKAQQEDLPYLNTQGQEPIEPIPLIERVELATKHAAHSLEDILHIPHR